jgi:hypothetical protein
MASPLKLLKAQKEHLIHFNLNNDTKRPAGVAQW